MNIQCPWEILRWVCRFWEYTHITYMLSAQQYYFVLNPFPWDSMLNIFFRNNMPFIASLDSVYRNIGLWNKCFFISHISEQLSKLLAIVKVTKYVHCKWVYGYPGFLIEAVVEFFAWTTSYPSFRFRWRFNVKKWRKKGCWLQGRILRYWVCVRDISECVFLCTIQCAKPYKWHLPSKI